MELLRSESARILFREKRRRKNRALCLCTAYAVGVLFALIVIFRNDLTLSF